MLAKDGLARARSSSTCNALPIAAPLAVLSKMQPYAPPCFLMLNKFHSQPVEVGIGIIRMVNFRRSMQPDIHGALVMQRRRIGDDCRISDHSCDRQITEHSRHLC